MHIKPCPVGTRYGRGIIIGESEPHTHPNGSLRGKSLLKCDCGKFFVAFNNALRSGHTQSCGCFRIERLKEACTTHGHTTKGRFSRTYLAWANMVQRCTNPKNDAFYCYGGIGITVCQRWRKSFECFLEDMGECPEGKEIDRYPTKNGNYEPDNCRWATQLEQNRNQKSNRVFTVRGITACMSELCEHFGVNYHRMRARMLLGWDIERALFQPVRKMRNNVCP